MHIIYILYAYINLWNEASVETSIEYKVIHIILYARKYKYTSIHIYTCVKLSYVNPLPPLIKKHLKLASHFFIFFSEFVKSHT